jgi:hypothetical protein
MDKHVKPRLLFLRFTRPGLPAYIQLHLKEQVKCLSQFFEVMVIEGGGDYGRLCDEYQPDLSVFESGVYVGHGEVTNISAHPAIPKLGFCHCDAYCETRKLFISDMARFGVETFFTTSVSLPSYTPSLAENLFVWPNFVDPDLYRDYELPKVVPALFTGSQATHYPWRNRINKLISEYYPSLQCPHSGWFNARAASRMISGEWYARMINAAWITPTCGTIANEVVRKHFEIPACKACLVTERTPGLEAAGFVDLVNCVFADEADVLDKVEWLFKSPDELQRITEAGYNLVHSRHTIRERDQVFQWFTLQKQLLPQQRVVQLGPFMPMTIVDRNLHLKNGRVMSGGLDRALLAQGDEKLWAGHYDEAEAFYRKCLNYHFIPEAKFRLVLCCLYKGNGSLALRLVSELIQVSLKKWKVEPDPIEWAYLIVALLCCGKLREASLRANQFEMLSNPELSHVREVVRMVSNQVRPELPADSQPTLRYSVHQLPECKKEEWIERLGRMLRACGQPGLVELMARPATLQDLATGGEHAADGITRLRPAVANGQNEGARMEVTGGRKFVRLKVAGYGERVKTWIRKSLQSVPLLAIRKVIGKVELKTGCFLPYQFSVIRYDEGVLAVGGLLREENIKSGLMIGAAAGEGKTEAFLEAMGANRNKPRAVCMNFATPGFRKLQVRLANSPSVQCRLISEQDRWPEPDAGDFDVVLIDGSEIGGNIEYDDAHNARFILLDDINALQSYDFCQTLLADPNYVLLAHNPSHRGGYAIFRRAINQ